MPLDSYEVQPMNWWRFSKHHANCKFSLASQMYVDSANLRWSLQLLNGLSRGHQLIHKSASANIDNKAVRSGLVEGEYKGRRKKREKGMGACKIVIFLYLVSQGRQRNGKRNFPGKQLFCAFGFHKEERASW